MKNEALEQAKQLEKKIQGKLKQLLAFLTNLDFSKLNSKLDRRISLSNNSFLGEVKSLSLIAVTAAPFSLALLLSGLEIEKTFLVASFTVLMANVLFLNIGVWYLNSKFKKSTASQRLEVLSMEAEASNALDEKKNTSARLDAVYELSQCENRLEQKKMFEPYKQEKTLSFLRDGGLILLSIGLILMILSVVWAIVPKNTNDYLVADKSIEKNEETFQKPTSISLNYNQRTGELFPIFPDGVEPHTCIWTIWSGAGSETVIVTKVGGISTYNTSSYDYVGHLLSNEIEIIKKYNFLPPKVPIYVNCVDWENKNYYGLIDEYE